MRELKAQAAALDPVVRIGKSGITEGIVKELSMQLKKKKLVKIKLLKALMDEGDRKQIAKDLAQKTGAILVQQVGGMVVLYKNEEKRKI